MKKFLRALIVPMIFLLSFAYASKAKAALFINEAMIDPSAVSDTYGEWLELYNDGAEGIDINGWIIKDAGSNTHTIDSGGALIVPAGGYLVLGRNSEPAQNGGYTPDYVYSNFTLTNTDDEIILEGGDPLQIYYNSVSWPIEAGQSLAYSGTGDANDPANWFATPAISSYLYGAGDYATPGGPNVMPEPATVLLMGAGLLMLKRKRKNDVTC